MLRYLSKRGGGGCIAPDEMQPRFESRTCSSIFTFRTNPHEHRAICHVSALRTHNPLPFQIIHNHIPPNCYPAPPEPDHLTPMPLHHRLPRPPVPLQPTHKQDPLRSPLRPTDLLVPCQPAHNIRYRTHSHRNQRVKDGTVFPQYIDRRQHVERNRTFPPTVSTHQGP